VSLWREFNYVSLVVILICLGDYFLVLKRSSLQQTSYGKYSIDFQFPFANDYTRASQDETMRILEARLLPPDPRFTWAQAPVWLEDALGRSILIPSEYSYDVRLKYQFLKSS